MRALKAALISEEERGLRRHGSEGSFMSSLSTGRILLNTTSLKKLQVEENKKEGCALEL